MIGHDIVYAVYTVSMKTFRARRRGLVWPDRGGSRAVMQLYGNCLGPAIRRRSRPVNERLAHTVVSVPTASTPCRSPRSR